MVHLHGIMIEINGCDKIPETWTILKHRHVHQQRLQHNTAVTEWETILVIFVHNLWTSFSSPKDQGQAPNYRYPEIDGESANLV